MNFIKTNRKTTFAAIATLTAAIAQAYVTRDFSGIGVAVTAALGLIFAQDA